MIVIRPWQVLSTLELSAEARLERDGRPATLLRGRPRGTTAGARRFLHGLPEGDAYEFLVDDATGIVVEMVAWWDGREVEGFTLSDLRVDGLPATELEALFDGQFDLDSLGPVETPKPDVLRPKAMAAVATEVDFTVLAPRNDSDLGRSYLGVVHRDERGITVGAHAYSQERPPGRRLWYFQSAGDAMADPASWETITLPDGTPARWWSPESDPDQGHLRFERAGTQVWIQGWGPAEIRDLAVALEPVT